MIEPLATERQRHWLEMGRSHTEDRAARVVAITKQLNGHAEDIAYYGARGEGLYGERRLARAQRWAKAGSPTGTLPRLRPPGVEASGTDARRHRAAA